MDEAFHTLVREIRRYNSTVSNPPVFPTLLRSIFVMIELFEILRNFRRGIPDRVEVQPNTRTRITTRLMALDVAPAVSSSEKKEKR